MMRSDESSLEKMEKPEITPLAERSSTLHKVATVLAVFLITLAIANGLFYWWMEDDLGGNALGTVPENGVYHLERSGNDDSSDSRRVPVEKDEWLMLLHLAFWTRMTLLVGLFALLSLILSQLDHHFVWAIQDPDRRKANRRGVLLAMIIFGAFFLLITKEVALGPEGAINNMQRSLKAHEEMENDK